MGVKICTWNSQGNPNNDETKLAVLRSLYNQNDVLLIQECGALDTSVLDNQATIHLVEQAGSMNNRCSSCIIAHRSLRTLGSIALPSGTGRFMIGVVFNHLNIYTLHAQSGAGAADLSIIQQCEEPFVLGGDMNCAPENLFQRQGYTRVQQIGSVSRPVGEYRIAHSSLTTHPGSNSELDYFLYSPAYLNHGKVYRYGVRGGDHHPVYTEFTLRYRGG